MIFSSSPSNLYRSVMSSVSLECCNFSSIDRILLIRSAFCLLYSPLVFDPHPFRNCLKLLNKPCHLSKEYAAGGILPFVSAYLSSTFVTKPSICIHCFSKKNCLFSIFSNSPEFSSRGQWSESSEESACRKQRG